MSNPLNDFASYLVKGSRFAVDSEGTCTDTKKELIDYILSYGFMRPLAVEARMWEGHHVTATFEIPFCRPPRPVKAKAPLSTGWTGEARRTGGGH